MFLGLGTVISTIKYFLFSITVKDSFRIMRFRRRQNENQYAIC